MSQENTIQQTADDIVERTVLARAGKAFRKLNHAPINRHIPFRPDSYLGTFRNEGMQLGFVKIIKDSDGIEKVSISSRPDGSDYGRMNFLLAKGLKPNRLMADNLTEVTFAVQGSLDEQGNPQAILIARKFDAPNFHQVRGRSILDILKFDESGKAELVSAEELRATQMERVRYSTDRQNIVRIAGIVVGFKAKNIDESEKNSEGSKMPYLEIHIRQDRNPNNVIPLRLVTRNIEQVTRLMNSVQLRLMAFTGSHKVERTERVVRDEAGFAKRDEDGNVIYVRDENGNIVYDYNSFIKITDFPQEASGYDVLFLDPNNKVDAPSWIFKLADETRQKMAAEQAARKARAEAKAAGKVVQAEQQSEGFTPPPVH